MLMSILFSYNLVYKSTVIVKVYFQQMYCYFALTVAVVASWHSIS